MGIELLYVVGAVLLLAGLIFGANQYRNRKQGERMVGDRKTRELYTEDKYRS